MTFFESGHGASNLAPNDLPELKCELAEIGNERVSLCKHVESQWPNIPPEAISYLAKTCPKAELMSVVVNQLNDLPEGEAQLLSDPDLMPYLIDDLISQAEINRLDIRQDQLDEKETYASTTQTTLSEINTLTANLKGRTKLETARKYLSNSDIPDTVREELTMRFDQIDAALASMSAVLTDPASQSEFNRIISGASLNLSAPNLESTFAPILDQVEASETFTAEQKFKLREIVTGSDAQNSLSETMTDENGNPVPRFTEKNKREFRRGVSGFVEGHGRQMIEARAGDRTVTKDVTGWSGQDVGLLIEMTHMWNMYESFGATAFIEDVYKIDFSILDNRGAFDPIQISHLRQVLSHLTGSHEGYDGDIADLSEHKTLIQNQARLLSDMQTAFHWQNDRSGMTKMLQRLGMEDADGNANLDVIKAFGDYTKEHYAIGTTDQAGLVNYLYKGFPEEIAPLSATETLNRRLDI